MRVLAVAGASGGHIFPAIGFLDRIKADDPKAETVLVLPRRSIKQYLPQVTCRLAYVSTTAVGLRPSLKNGIGCFNFLKGLAQSFFILAEFRPDVVVGFGSIVSIPVILWAWLFRVRIVLHEQNVVPGQATRFLSRIADTVAVSFEQTISRLPKGSCRAVVTGNIVRKSLRQIAKQDALAYFKFSPDRLTLLVAGGSQASRRINQYFCEAMDSSVDLARLQVIHLCGREDLPAVRGRYTQLGIPFFAADFLAEMQYAYSAADFVVSRAGATTIAELVQYRLPALLIPYPYAAGHQIENARFLQKISTATVIADEKMNASVIRASIGQALMSPRILQAMRAGYRTLADTDAAGGLSSLVYEAVSSDKGCV